MSRVTQLAVCLALLGVGAAAAAGNDKSGVSPQAISLPSGPGSIEGLGESFQPQLNTGTFVYQVPFKRTPVRGAVRPRLTLEYNSGYGNGRLGMGWELNLPHVERLTERGLPTYTDADTFVEESNSRCAFITMTTARTRSWITGPGTASRRADV